jgi:lipopolysaccharide/colanic/teichoic acid biosynthesis glycosyltransferase
VIKRACDIAVASIGLVLLSPLLLLLAVAIKVSSPGPVFYRGERIGRYGQPFRIFKFRSMVVDAEKLGGSSSGDDDPRITPIGRFMRKCKLDELPQLINVLLGDMSMVGPRPEVARFVAMYTPEERVILTIRPGITDWASLWNSDEGAILAGAEDPDQAYLELIRPTKIRLQLKYVEERSLGTDMRILVLTVLRLLQKDRIPEEIRSLCQ